MKPANGAMSLAEMKEFAGFAAATQRYIRRSLDIGLDRDDAMSRWSRDVVEAASIRAQARLYGRLLDVRQAIPDDSGLDAVETFLTPLVTVTAFDLGQGPADQLFRIPLSLRAADRRGVAAVAAERLLCRRVIAAASSGPAPQAAPDDQRGRGNRIRLVQPPADVLPEMGGEGRGGSAAKLIRAAACTEQGAGCRGRLARYGRHAPSISSRGGRRRIVAVPSARRSKLHPRRTDSSGSPVIG